MTFDLQKWLRPNIKALEPYRSARQEFSGVAEILLDANENPFVDQHNRYPDPLQLDLKKRLAEIKNIEASRIFLGNGSDEAIDLLVRIFCQPPHDFILTTPPTFSWFKVCAQVAGAGVRKVLLDDNFQPRVDQILAESDDQGKLLCLCSPNNPTGNEFEPQLIEALIKGWPSVVVVDEAYKDFSDEPSWITRLDEFPNLIVTQTFSKAWGLAGIRLGMAFASQEIISLLNKVKPPYNVNSITQETALEALQNYREIKQIIGQIRSERSRVRSALQDLHQVEHVYPSDANFLLVKFADSAAIYRDLLEVGVIVRDRSNEPGCENCLRITIGTPAENDRLLDGLMSYA